MGDVLLLLVTRPQDEAERTAEALRARGHEAVLAPVLRIEAAADADPGAGPWNAVLMTSANAARTIAAHPLRDKLLCLPLYAVGRQTARTAREIGFTQVISADGDAGDLARLVSGAVGGGKLLYLAGNDRARDLPGELAAAGLRVDTAVIYRATAAKNLPRAAQEALQQGTLNGALHYSQRSVRILLDCVESAGLLAQFSPLRHYCLSPRVAEPLAAAGASDIQIAPRPDEAALIGLIG